jgi:DNA-binding MarR family transcriptional regulator
MATEVTNAKLTAVELGAWRGLLRAHASLVKRLDADLEQAHGLALNQYEVLLYLEQSAASRMRMCDLADSVLLSRSGLTRLVDRLVRDGLVTRVTCEQDARGTYAELTPYGHERLAEARRTHLAGIRDYFLARFSEEEMEQLAEYWERLAPGSVGGADDVPSCG